MRGRGRGDRHGATICTRNVGRPKAQVRGSAAPGRPAPRIAAARRAHGLSQREAKAIESRGVRGILDNAQAFDAETVRAMQRLAAELKLSPLGATRSARP